MRVFRMANGQLIDANAGHWAVAPKYMLPDGRAILIEPIYDTSFDRYWKYLNIVVDVNGAKGPCVMGWDVFLFTLFNYTRYDGKKIGLKLGSIGSGDGAYNRTSEIIQQEGKKVKSDLDDKLRNADILDMIRKESQTITWEI